MHTIQQGYGFITYEGEKSDPMMEAVKALARLSAEQLPDNDAAKVSILFDVWRAGAVYTKGQRISNGAGKLFRVEQDHTAQEDRPVEGTPALYIPLGVTEGVQK